ncbi:MAG: hypothetical protein V4669_09355 [Pseudomonadota bacterium]
MKRLLAALAAAAACAPISAQTIYRCGDAYSQTPCAGAVVIQTGQHPVQPRDMQAARAASLRDARLADAMEKDRLMAESRPASLNILPAGKQPSDASSSEKKVVMSKPDKLHVFTAHAPVKPGGEKTKARKKKSKPA